MSNFMKILPARAELFEADWRRDRQVVRQKDGRTDGQTERH